MADCSRIVVKVTVWGPTPTANTRPERDFTTTVRSRDPTGRICRIDRGASWPVRPKRRRTRYRSEEHTSELQSLMRISYAVCCLKKKKHNNLTLTSLEQISHMTV